MEPLVQILRLEDNKTYGTFGVLLINGRAFCVTLEPPWVENERNVSCVPEGQYQAIRVPSEKFGEVFLLEDIPGRSGIEIHPGNVREDTEGCIIVASSFGKLRNHNRAVLNSGDTFRSFMRVLEYTPRIKVSIKNSW